MQDIQYPSALRYLYDRWAPPAVTGPTPIWAASTMTGAEIADGRRLNTLRRAPETPHCPPGLRPIGYTDAYLRLINRR
jgi:hypothetical protein